jgi:hypothetical protein
MITRSYFASGIFNHLLVFGMYVALTGEGPTVYSF